MEIITQREDLLAWKSRSSHQAKGITFVPTMGALHAGHISLIQLALQREGAVLSSIFINPLQFNHAGDLAAYPKTPESDLNMLRHACCDAVYMPEYNQVYPEGIAVKHFDLGELEGRLEGAFRPGHFQGVANVLYRLFMDVEPTEVVLGLKDYQQFMVVQELGRQHFPTLRITGAPTLREESGLAMSSRNRRLSKAEHQQASLVAKQLIRLQEVQHTLSFETWKSEFSAFCQTLPAIRIEYVELAEQKTLRTLNEWPTEGAAVVLIAFYSGATRLIDNIILA
ncbi:MAG: pantoate--beta-alanine ligase [Bacteroidetes bacterium]|nr:pantoate--beta-alanine ligase [Bacteroidota bacterium]